MTHTVGYTVNNEARGCGYLKEGGFYASADMSVGGTLNAWTPIYSSSFNDPVWAEGESLYGVQGYQLPHNYLLQSPPRAQTMIHLRGSLQTGLTQTDQDSFDQNKFDAVNLMKISPFAILDHVGNEYTPLSFSVEVKSRGPNRRITPALAGLLARYLPLPIVFSHSGCLMAPSVGSIQKEFTDGLFAKDAQVWRTMENLSVDSLADYQPSHWLPGWGMAVDSSTMEMHPQEFMHWMVKRWRDEVNNFNRWREILPLSLASAGWSFSEMAFGASWLTSVIYVCQEGEDAFSRVDLIQQGIIPVYAGERDSEDSGADEDDF